MTIKLNSNYRNRETGHFVRPVSLDRSAGRVNERVEARNLTTGQTESWSTRLFLADHDLQAFVVRPGAAIGGIRQYAIYQGDKFVEGGFFVKAAAALAAEQHARGTRRFLAI